MRTSRRHAGKPSRNGVLKALTDGRRRRLLALLLDRTDPVDEEELAVHLAAAEHGTSLLRVDETTVEPIRSDLQHVQFPVLEDANLVVRDANAGTVTTTDHPALQDPKLRHIVETEVDDWDAVLECLASRRRRIVLSVLVAREPPVGRTTLMSAVAAREQDGPVDPGEVEPTRNLRVDLHHVHLPKLADAGLIDYDPDAGTAAYDGHPEVPEEWLASWSGVTPRHILTAAEQSLDTWRLRGREQVTERVRSLLEYADDELFVVFTSEERFEEAFLRCVRDAVDSGVDIYLGSKTPELRDLVREEVPEVTLWEPQLDWPDRQSDHEAVGQFVLADREAAMLGTLGRKTTGVPEETAITGTGEGNDLVVRLRELLGSQLGHLDVQSEDVRTHIPL